MLNSKWCSLLLLPMLVSSRDPPSLVYYSYDSDTGRDANLRFIDTIDILLRQRRSNSKFSAAIDAYQSNNKPFNIAVPPTFGKHVRNSEPANGLHHILGGTPNELNWNDPPVQPADGLRHILGGTPAELKRKDDLRKVRAGERFDKRWRMRDIAYGPKYGVQDYGKDAYNQMIGRTNRYIDGRRRGGASNEEEGNPFDIDEPTDTYTEPQNDFASWPSPETNGDLDQSPTTGGNNGASGPYTTTSWFDDGVEYPSLHDNRENTSPTASLLGNDGGSRSRRRNYPMAQEYDYDNSVLPSGGGEWDFPQPAPGAPYDQFSTDDYEFNDQFGNYA